MTRLTTWSPKPPKAYMWVYDLRGTLLGVRKGDPTTWGFILGVPYHSQAPIYSGPAMAEVMMRGLVTRRPGWAGRWLGIRGMRCSEIKP